MRVAIYSPYLHILGGGEKYITVLAEDLSKRCAVDIFTLKEVTISQLHDRLNVNLHNVRIQRVRQDPPIGWPRPTTNYLSKVIHHWKISKEEATFTRGYDLLIYVTNTIPPFPLAKTNVVVIQFPMPCRMTPRPPGFRKALRHFLYTRLALQSRLRAYDLTLCYSFYVQRWIRKYWRVSAEVLYPPIDVEDFRPACKERKILSVGRFFPPGNGHNKKQHFLIDTFRQLCDDRLGGWQLHLAGGLDDNARDVEYFNSLYGMAAGYPIFFHPNVGFEKLRDLYASSSIFWHATGYDIQEQNAPGELEHLGMTTAEAMAAQCVPVVIKKGGQPELVSHGWDGFLWETSEELKHYTVLLTEHEAVRSQMAVRSEGRSKDFSRRVFLERFWDLFGRVTPYPIQIW